MKKNRKKLRYLFAAFAVVLCMAALPLTAYAGGGDETEEPPAETVEAVEAEPNPFTPGGTGTVMDTATDENGKLFFTITTPSENVFYLVIDQQRTDNNVYFLGAVTENDLLALAEPSDSTGNESALPDDSASAEPEPATTTDPAEEQEPEAEAEQELGGGAGMIILAVVVILGAGGAGYYFKIYRPKQEAAASGDEYEGPEPDEGAWDDDAAPWDDGAEPWEDDGPPWDEDEETAEAREEYETTGEGEDE